MDRLLFKRVLVVCACLFALTARAAADSLADALRAYDGGDYAKAVALLKPLAAQGNAEAQFKLATLYYSGKGAAKDYRQAERLYRLSAEQGHVPAQSNLATMYYSGIGIRQDFVLAHMWKDIAASNAEGERKQRYLGQLGELEKIMNAKQISEAQKLAKKCTANKFKGCKRSVK